MFPFLLGLTLVALVSWPGTTFADPLTQPSGNVPLAGHYRILVVPGNQQSPFLIDTVSGCMWRLIKDKNTKPFVAVEADAQNLDLSYAEVLMVERIDFSPLTNKSKRGFKPDLQKGKCGRFTVGLTPEPPPPNEQAPEP